MKMRAPHFRARKIEAAKHPRGFKLIGQTSKAVLRATMDVAPAVLHHRHFGNCSPLDRLPKKVKGELRKRCKAGVVFWRIRDWLMAEHQCRTSTSSLSDWWRRQPKIGRKPQVAGAQFEFIVHAPGASEIPVLVKSR